MLNFTFMKLTTPDLDFNADFSLDDFSGVLDIKREFKTRYIKPPKSTEIADKNLKYSNAVKLATDIKKLKDHRYFIIVNGSFIFGDFIEAFIVQHNLHVKKMTISTLSLSENNVDSLAILLNGEFIDQLNLIVSDYFYSHERGNLVPYLYKELDKGNKFQLAAASTHCKLCIFETHCGHHVVIHGSANLRSSSNIEQFVIEESKELYDFNDKYQDFIIKKFKTINKSVRGKELWHQDQVVNPVQAGPEPEEQVQPDKELQDTGSTAG
jgi:hypothetical protein